MEVNMTAPHYRTAAAPLARDVCNTSRAGRHAAAAVECARSNNRQRIASLMLKFELSTRAVVAIALAIGGSGCSSSYGPSL